MSTRANIKFQDGDDFIHIDRSHDGHPENVLADIEECVKRCKGLWSGAELGQLVSAFLGMNYKENNRIQNYEPCIGYETAGDDNYRYYVKWNAEKRAYDFGVIE